MGGLGTAICKALAKDGFIVVANCLPAFPQKDEWLAKMQTEGFDMKAAEGDVSDYESCKAMIEKVEQEIGPLAVVVNNAGITRDKFFVKMDKSQWDAVLTTNLDSLFNVTHPVAAKMAERGWGRIINISSVAGIIGNRGQVNYSAAKGALHAASKALALELASRGITVNAVAPGIIATDMSEGAFDSEAIQKLVPMKRAGRPEEVADLVAFLASDQAGYISGQVVSINGAMI